MFDKPEMLVFVTILPKQHGIQFITHIDAYEHLNMTVLLSVDVYIQLKMEI